MCIRDSSSSSASAAVRSMVLRIVFAWKKVQRLDASMLELSAAVCAPFPRVSENASTRAKTEMSSAIFLLEGSTWPCSDILRISKQLKARAIVHVFRRRIKAHSCSSARRWSIRSGEDSRGHRRRVQSGLGPRATFVLQVQFLYLGPCPGRPAEKPQAG